MDRVGEAGAPDAVVGAGVDDPANAVECLEDDLVKVGDEVERVRLITDDRASPPEEPIVEGLADGGNGKDPSPEASESPGEAHASSRETAVDGPTEEDALLSRRRSGARFQKFEGKFIFDADAIYGPQIVEELTTNLYSDESLSFEEFSAANLDRLYAIFGKPVDFSALVSSRGALQFGEVFLVHGPDRSGKLTCAVNLALRIRETRLESPHIKIVQYQRPKSSQLPIGAALVRAEWPTFSVVILRDCFERNLSYDDLEAAQLYQLMNTLQEKRSVLILTGDLPQDKLDLLATRKLDARLSSPVLQEVFSASLAHDARTRQILLSAHDLQVIVELWSDVSHYLVTPFHINQFVHKLRQTPVPEMDDEGALKKLVVALAHEVSTSGGQAARAWFNELRPNEVLFALLIHLFDGAERIWLETLAEKLIGELRQEGFDWLSDPRTMGLEDAREKVHAVERAGRLEIEDRVYEQEIRAQVRNRGSLLWDIFERLLALRPKEEWTDPWRRRGLGVALARVGVWDERRFTVVLKKLAEDGDRLCAVVAGYALQETLRPDPEKSFAFVTRIVREWINSRDPLLMWSAGAALWRLYEAAAKCPGEEQRRLLALLSELGEHHRRFALEGVEKEQEPRVRFKHMRLNASCVVEAMRQIALIDPVRATDELRAWFVKSGSELPALARGAVLAIYERFAKKRQRPSDSDQAVFIRLLPSLLEQGDAASFEADAAFLTVRAWLKWPEIEPKVGAELMRLARHPSARVRERLRSTVTRLWLDPRPAAARRVAGKLARRWVRKDEAALQREADALTTFWCEDPEGRERAHRIAQAVAARCNAADGALPLLASMGRGIVVVDPGLLLGGEAREAIDGFLWEVLALLESHVDLTVLRLGEGAPLLRAPQPEEAAAAGTPADERGAAESVSLAGLDPTPSFPSHRLVMPGVLAANAPPCADRDAPRPNIVLLAHDAPHDLDDLVDAPWPRRLYLVSAGDERAEASSAHALRLTITWPPMAEDLSLVLSAFERVRAREIAAASPEHWGELMRSFGIEDPASADVGSLLDAWAAGLDTYSPETTGRHDSIARSVAVLLFVAARDLREALARIVAWLPLPSQPDDAAAEDEARSAAGPASEGSPSRHAVASAAAFALIRLYTAFPPEAGGAVRAPTSLFESLAEPLAAIGPDGSAAIVRLVAHWVEDPVWAEYLAGDVREGRGRLERWAVTRLANQPELAAELTERLARSRPEANAHASWIALSSIVGRLDERRRNEYPTELPPLEAGQRYVLLVVDPAPSEGAGDRRSLLRKLAADLYDAIRGEGDGLVPLIFRAGDRRLFWAAEEAPVAGRLGLPVPRPLLVGPIFEAAEAWYEAIEKVLLLVDTKPLDLDDWADSAWWRRLALYGAGAPSPTARFAAIPRPFHRAGDADRIDDASRITVHLGELARQQVAAAHVGESRVGRKGATSDVR